MFDESRLMPFDVWLIEGIPVWLTTLGMLLVTLLVLCWSIGALRRGPLESSRILGRALSTGILDLVCLSPRRIMALAWLVVKESIRRRVVVVFAVFLLVLLFAGWFLDPASSNPAQLYIGFVLTATSYLVLLLSLILSALSLPTDVKNRTIYTVVTKPVRASEVVLGRIVGFALVGTALLIGMGTISYVFVWRGMRHSHEVALAKLEAEEGGRTGTGAEAVKVWKGRTGPAQGHRHDVYVDSRGRVRVEVQNGHWHELTLTAEQMAALEQGNSKISISTSDQRGMLVARVPQWGRLRFLDRTGRPAEKGINVGDEWTYRSYIEGGSLGAAIWNFENISEVSFPDGGLPVEMNIGVFRSHKGDIEKGVLASLSLRNPDTGLSVEAQIFPAKEFEIDTHFIPRRLQTAEGRKVDLFRDLAPQGRLEIWLRCVDPVQYFGVAQPDLYLRARDNSFLVNFAKGYLGIWLQMLLLISFGVMYSTFLSGPVAMLATLGTMVAGFFRWFIADMAAGKNLGGGPMESLIRIVNQPNITSKLEPGLTTTVAQTIDKYLQWILGAVAAVLPELGTYDFSTIVANGFSVGGNLVGIGLVGVAAFVLPLFVAGYILFKTREVA